MIMPKNLQELSYAIVLFSLIYELVEYVIYRFLNKRTIHNFP
jgi:hypothetical protein